VSFNYPKSAKTALRLLASFGQTINREVVESGAYAPSTGEAAQRKETTSRIGVEVPITNGQTTIAGMQIESTSVQLYLDAEGEVKLTDRYLIGNKQYSVKAFEALKPAGIPVLYTLHLVAA
jgi:hypothetical protein